MAAILKCLLAVVVVLCFMQFVEMARIQREVEANKVDPLADLDALFGKLKDSIDTEKLKEFLNTATQIITENTKAMKDSISEHLSKN